MSKLNSSIIASSALLLILQSGSVLSETPKKKVSAAKGAVATLQNGYTSVDTSARPQGVIPTEFGLVKVDGVGSSSGGTDNPELPPPPPPTGSVDPDTPNGGTDNPVLPPPPPPTGSVDPDTPNGGTDNPDLPPPPPPISAG